jgi:hypothetical protein
MKLRIIAYELRVFEYGLRGMVKKEDEALK